MEQIIEEYGIGGILFVLCNGVESRCLWKHHIFHK